MLCAGVRAAIAPCATLPAPARARASNMTLALRLAYLLAATVLADPAPARVPKVYNALITSNQNLEPSKAYPVYQPVLHDAFAFPFQPAVFYTGDFPVNNGLLPGNGERQGKESTEAPSPPSEVPREEPKEEPTEKPVPPPEPSTEAPKSENKPTPASPLPPNTESPIPLNEFGLPPQLFPLGPNYNGFTQLGPYPYGYPYPGFRFFDPYVHEPFSISPYANFPPLYRPFPNILNPAIPVGNAVAPSQPPQEQAAPQPSSQAPPREPNDLNVLNYSSKDPSIPNVPPPPLPQGGLRSDSSE